MSALRGVTLGVRFLCELGMLAALAAWGANVAQGIGSVVIAIGAPIASAAVWWAFVAPKARWPVPLGVRVAIEFVLFAVASLALWATGRPIAAALFAPLALATSALNAVQERAGQPVPGARGVD